MNHAKRQAQGKPSLKVRRRQNRRAKAQQEMIETKRRHDVIEKDGPIKIIMDRMKNKEFGPAEMMALLFGKGQRVLAKRLQKGAKK